MLAQVFAVIAPVFLCAFIGFIWARQGRPFDTQLVTTLVTNIGTPGLVLATLIDTKIEPDAFFEMGAAAAATMITFYVVYFVVLKLWGLSQRAFLSALVYGNVGNMGLPLCLLAFGDQGLALAISYFTVNVLLLFTLGIAVPAGTASFKQLVRMPALYAIAAALVFMTTDLVLPDWILNTARILGGLTIPLMLITLGVSLASLQVDSLMRSVWLSLLRLVPGFLIGLGVAEMFGMTGAAKGVLIIQCAMPVAVFNYLFAVRYDNRPAEVAGTVVVSTALSFLTLPLLMGFVMDATAFPS